MIVFKTTLKILNKLKGIIILYTIMLLSITLFNQSSNSIDNFEASKPDILIVNKDTNNIINKDFINYLDKHTNILDINNYDDSLIEDAIFYRSIDLVLYIPNNYMEDYINGNNTTIDYKSSNNIDSSLGIMLVENYLKTLSIYKDYYTNEDLLKVVNSTLNNNIEVNINTKLDTSSINRMNTYYNFLNYAFLAGCVYSISMILASLKKENVLKRTIVSSYNYKKYNRMVLLSCGLIMLILWFLYTILGFILFKELLLSTNGLLCIFNSFIFSICSLLIGLLIGNITSNKNALSGIINVVAVGSSFLCGSFVPMEYMPNYVLTIAHILPSYYYVYNNNFINSIEAFNNSNIFNILINDLIILGFSILFIIIINIISKKKRVL